MLFGLLIVGCTPAPAGMAPHSAAPDQARVQPGRGERALLVAYPRSACSGSARIVLLDADAHFVGAVGPGEAALLVVKQNTHHLFAMSAVDVTSAPGTWSTYQTLHVPDAPSGLIATTAHLDHKHCGTGQYATFTTASREQIEATLGESEVRWLEPRATEGQSWIDAHHDRVIEVLASR